MSRLFVLFITVFLTACTTDIAGTVESEPQSVNIPSKTAIRVFEAPPNRRDVSRSNVDIAAEILDLAFYLESGRPVKFFTRFEGPVTVSLSGNAPRFAKDDLDKLILRLRKEADLDISMISDNMPANITVDFINGTKMRAFVPSAACFIVPGASSFSEVLKKSRDISTDWSQISKREKVVVVIPQDAAPQEVRDCLHEEIAQALGPLNDLYRLADSVYNDDNFHLVLTPFDMLALRVFYSPSLKTGMSKDQVSERLPAIINRLNPRGRGYVATGQQRTPTAWAKDIRGAVGPTGSASQRVRKINAALQKSNQYGFKRNRLGYVLYARGRLLSRTEQEEAIKSYTRAYELYKRLYGAEDIHTARSTVQLISIAIAAADLDRAKQLLAPSKIAAKKSQDAGLLMNLLGLEAEIQRLSGNDDAVASLRQEAREWGMYAFGNSRDVERILNIIKQIGRAGMQNAEG